MKCHFNYEGGHGRSCTMSPSIKMTSYIFGFVHHSPLAECRPELRYESYPQLAIPRHWTKFIQQAFASIME